MEPRALQLRLPGPGAPPSRGAKRLLLKAGEMASDRIVYGLLGIFNYVHLGRWLKRRKLPVRAIVRDRYEVFELIGAAVRDGVVLYLEFGVAEGDSLRCFSRLLRNPASMLHGFDSFQGLPSEWALGWPPNSFSRGGVPPRFEDPRVQLFQGWFSETLPHYDWPSGYDVLVVTLDADVYSSTSYVLETIEQHIEPGTILYFDEFHHYADELKAFDELVERTGWRFEILAATDDFAHITFRRLA